MSGEFLHSLVATDVYSGWTEAVSLLAREQSLVVEGLKRIQRQLPVPVRGIDSDNDGAFINDTLASYCQQEKITFTRSKSVPQKRSGFDPTEERRCDSPHDRLPAAVGNSGRSGPGAVV